MCCKPAHSANSREMTTSALASSWETGQRPVALGAAAVLRLEDDPGDELARFDAEERQARRPGAPPARVLLCSADAHGYPGYRAAFEAFSMHVPVALTGDPARDAAAVTAALARASDSLVTVFTLPRKSQVKRYPRRMISSLNSMTRSGVMLNRSS